MLDLLSLRVGQTLRVGQNRNYTLYMTVFLIQFPTRLPDVYVLYMVLVNVQPCSFVMKHGSAVTPHTQRFKHGTWYITSFRHNPLIPHKTRLCNDTAMTQQ